MAKRKSTVKAKAKVNVKHTPVKPKLSSGNGGIFTAQVVAIRKKQMKQNG